MAATYSALSITHRPQPALLYILPCMLIIYLTAAFLRREFLKMVNYDEDSELDGSQKTVAIEGDEKSKPNEKAQKVDQT